MAGDALSVFGATVIALAIGFVTSIVVARLLGPDGRGLLGVASSIAAVSVAIGSLGIPIAISYYASRRPRLMSELIGNALAYAAVLLIGLLVLSLMVSDSRLDCAIHCGVTPQAQNTGNSSSMTGTKSP